MCDFDVSQFERMTYKIPKVLFDFLPIFGLFMTLTFDLQTFRL